MTKFGYLVLACIILALALIGGLAWELMRTPAPLPPAPVQTTATPPAPAAEPCALGDCPFEIHEEDSGKTFTYSLTSRFTVILDGTKHPKENLSCEPEGIIGTISNIPAVSPPLYAARFEGTAPGTCVLADGDFSATIVITDQPAGAPATTTDEAAP